MSAAPNLKPVAGYGLLVDMAQRIVPNTDSGINPRFTPSDPATKYPPYKGWHTRATDDLAKLEKLCRKYPRATMPSVLTGAPSGFFGVDCDHRNGGDESLTALEKKYGQLDTCYYLTPGGLRLVFRLPKGCNVYNRAGDIAPGIDVRGSRADGSKPGQMVVPDSVNAKDGEYRWPEEYCGLHGVAEAPLWLLFLVIFNKATRARLAEIGVAGHEGFGGLPPAQWEARARELLRANAPAELRTVIEDDAKKGQLERYVSGAITKELKHLAGVDLGKRDTETNNSGLRINSLIKGAALLGLDTTKIEEAAEASFLETANKLMPDAPSDQWAEDKWRRTAVDANPRVITLKQFGSDAVLEFEAIEEPDATAGPAATPAPKLIEHVSEISLAEILHRQSNALVKGLLHRGETMVLYGEPGAGKTFVMLDLDWHIALGREWYDRAVKQAPVLYVCLEGVQGFRKRMLAAAQVHGEVLSSRAS